MDRIEKLHKLKELKDSGMIDEEEFKQEKEKIEREVDAEKTKKETEKKEKENSYLR